MNKDRYHFRVCKLDAMNCIIDVYLLFRFYLFESCAFFILPAIITGSDELETLDVVIFCFHLTKKSMFILSSQID